MEMLMGGIILRQQNNTGSMLVQTVDDAWALLTADPFQIRDVCQGRVH